MIRRILVSHCFEGGQDFSEHLAVEGKADDHANDVDVLAKKDAALDWVRQVNDESGSFGRWRYMFATGAALWDSKVSWEDLKKLAGLQSAAVHAPSAPNPSFLARSVLKCTAWPTVKLLRTIRPGSSLGRGEAVAVSRWGTISTARVSLQGTRP